MRFGQTTKTQLKKQSCLFVDIEFTANRTYIETCRTAANRYDKILQRLKNKAARKPRVRSHKTFPGVTISFDDLVSDHLIYAPFDHLKYGLPISKCGMVNLNPFRSELGRAVDNSPPNDTCF